MTRATTRWVQLLVLAASAVAGAEAAEVPALRLAGESTAYRPLLGFDVLSDGRVEVPVSLVAAGGDVSAFPLDRYGTKSSAAPQLSPRARLGLRFTGPKRWGSWSLLAEYEHDLSVVQGMPGSEPLATQLRKASLRVGYSDLVLVGGGVMTSHWGLGLLANDGAHGWEPGNARFADPRGGDRVLRGFLGTGPHTGLGLAVALAVDRVLDDDTLLLGQEQGLASPAFDDRATQAVGSVSLGRPGADWAGVYVALRNQVASGGRELSVIAFDVAATTKRAVFEHGTLTLGLEAAFLAGSTTLAGTPAFPEQQVRQLGLLTRNGLDLGRFGFALDGAFTSGDRNGDDAAQNAFRADPNADMGLLLFRQVLATQTARAVAVAGDPVLVGVPAPGLERLPTRGAFTNTLSLFPRAFVRPVDWVEVYGGVLFAWSAMPLFDPFNTRLAGGALRNSLDGKPGGLLGVELDLGARARLLMGGTELMVGLEGGLLTPGGAFHTADGKTMGTVTGGRVLLGYRL
ncbi:MAG: hypothetical protein ACYC8T_22035 [Myxococcaceae bacterium]